MYPQSSFYASRFPVWGAAGITASLIFYLCFSIVVIAGTLLLGRRWQCSTLCLFNGFASEVFAPAFPLVGKVKEMKPYTLKLFSVLKWVFFAVALFFTMYWIMLLSGMPLPGNIQVIRKAEEYTYLSGELLAAMFFWVAFIGRGYCYYCPLGTVIGFLGKAAGQRIITDNTKCIKCGNCNKTCSMSIDIMGKAQAGKASAELRCVGCGHCVDACPTKTLSYTTRFLDKINRIINAKTLGVRLIDRDESSKKDVGV
jgi:polyferredoxin